jgi:hypothetical protein
MRRTADGLRKGGSFHDLWVDQKGQESDPSDTELESIADQLSNSAQFRASQREHRDYMEYADIVLGGEGESMALIWDWMDRAIPQFQAACGSTQDLDPETIVMWGAGTIALAMSSLNLMGTDCGSLTYPQDVLTVLEVAYAASRQLDSSLAANEGSSQETRTFRIDRGADGCLVVGSDKKGYTVSMATCLVWLEYAQYLESVGELAQAFLHASRVARCLIVKGSLNDSLFSGYLSVKQAEGLGMLRALLQRTTATPQEGITWDLVHTEVDALSFLLEREMEQHLLASGLCPDWLQSEVDYWADVDVPPGTAEELPLRRGSTKIRSNTGARMTAQGHHVATYPPMSHTLARKMLQWASEECSVDCFDVDGTLPMLDSEFIGEYAAAGLFWTTQYILETQPHSNGHETSEPNPDWDQVHRLLIGTDWVQGVALMHRGQIVRMRRHPMLTAQAFLEWAEPLANREASTVVLYGAAVISLMVSTERERVGEHGVPYHHEDLRLVMDTVHTANRMLGDYSSGSGWPWGYDYYHGEILQAHLECSVLAGRLLADIEWAWLQAHGRNWLRAFVRIARALGAMLDGSILVGGMHIPYLGGPFADASSPGAFADVRHWFEAILSDPSQVADWDEISQTCQSLVAGLRADMSVRRSYEDDVPEWEVLEWAYWEQAATSTMSRLTPDQFALALRRRDEEQHRTRLRSDVFYDTWESMEHLTQTQLVTMERNWYESSSSPEALGNTPNDLRKVLEIETRACLYPLRSTIERMLSDPMLRSELGLRSRYFDGITLGDMGRLLQRAHGPGDPTQPLRSALESTALADNDREFMLIHLPKYARPLWDARNDAEHEFRWDAKQIARLRRRLLGIDCPGVLPQLVRIKRKLRDSARLRASQSPTT